MDPTARREAKIERLLFTVLDGPGVTSAQIRMAAASGGPLPDALTGYTEKVRDRSYRVTDADVDALRVAGHDEDAIFEVTVVAAVGASEQIFDTGMRALRAER